MLSAGSDPHATARGCATRREGVTQWMVIKCEAKSRLY